MQLMTRAQAGDVAALNCLLERYVPRLRRWASGRLPRWARDMRDTNDLVQDTIIGVLPRLSVFEFRHDGAFQAYLRHALLNRIREEIRREHRRPERAELHADPAAGEASPLEQAISRETVEIYEAALKRLSREDQEAIVARVELQTGYQEIAESLGKPSPDAARMAVSRALIRLAKEMNRGR